MKLVKIRFERMQLQGIGRASHGPKGGYVAFLSLALSCTVRTSATRIVYWVGKRFDNSQMRVAGIVNQKIAKRGRNIEYRGNNHCRRPNCDFIGIQVQKALNSAIRVSRTADVLLVAAQLLESVSNRAQLQRLLPPRGKANDTKPLRVLYWREGKWSVPLWIQQEFDVSMGVHVTSSIMNPSFFPRPALFSALDSALGKPPGSSLSSPPSFEDRTRFAYVMITNCDAEPRTSYLAALRQYIEIDEYGECTKARAPYRAEEIAFRRKLRKLSSYSIHDVNAMAHFPVGRHYKFYFAFENTLAEGYVTEKLLSSPLMSGIVPVYMGAPDLSRRLASLDDAGLSWYIDVLDFDTPQHLASYLKLVGNNRSLWETYGAWRSGIRESEEKARINGEPSSFALFPSASRAVRESMNDSLLLAQINPGAASRLSLVRRVATICRLCDLNYMHSLAPVIPVAPPLEATKLACLFTSNCSCRGATRCRVELNKTSIEPAENSTRNYSQSPTFTR